ncbi:MAG: hypothetical protein WEA31_02150, partial [Pirellulales bacterium]
MLRALRVLRGLQTTPNGRSVTENFVIRHSGFFRHSDFDIRHSELPIGTKSIQMSIPGYLDFAQPSLALT